MKQLRIVVSLALASGEPPPSPPLLNELAEHIEQLSAAAGIIATLLHNNGKRLDGISILVSEDEGEPSTNGGPQN